MSLLLCSSLYANAFAFLSMYSYTYKICLNNKILFVHFQQCHIFLISFALDCCACMRIDWQSHKSKCLKIVVAIVSMAKSARARWNDSWHNQKTDEKRSVAIVKLTMVAAVANCPDSFFVLRMDH